MVGCYQQILHPLKQLVQANLVAALYVTPLVPWLYTSRFTKGASYRSVEVWRERAEKKLKCYLEEIEGVDNTPASLHVEEPPNNTWYRWYEMDHY